MKNLDELIEINLKLISEQPHLNLHRDYFIDINGKELRLHTNTALFAEILLEKGLVMFSEHGNYINYITNKGIKIVENGGWILHLKNQDEKLTAENNRKLAKENLDIEKATVDLELAKKMLKEFPRTKTFAFWGFVISIITTILALLQIIGVLS